MSNMFFGTGNIGTNPEVRNVSVNGEARKVLELRVFFDAYQRDSTGALVQNDSASFWKDVTLWGERAERAASHLIKGARVAVIGELRGEKWTDKDSGEERTKDAIRADDIYLSFARVESVRFKTKSERTDAEQVAAEA
jgi:single-strand DNA-binding protein